MIEFIDEKDVKLLIEKIMENNGNSPYDSEKWIRDFISGETYEDKIKETRISSLVSKIKFMQAQMEVLKEEIRFFKNKNDELCKRIDELDKENNNLCDEADGYCDEIEYYKDILSCLNLRSLGFEDEIIDEEEDMVDPSVMEEEPLDMQDIRRRFFNALDAQEDTHINMEVERREIRPRERERREHIENILGAIRNNE
jgi:FtsZ-binding cell division protein ZapB